MSWAKCSPQLGMRRMRFTRSQQEEKQAAELRDQTELARNQGRFSGGAHILRAGRCSGANDRLDDALLFAVTGIALSVNPFDPRRGHC